MNQHTHQHLRCEELALLSVSDDLSPVEVGFCDRSHESGERVYAFFTLGAVA